MTLPLVTATPAWVDAARVAWGARADRVEPLRVTAWMRSPVAFDRDAGLRLEGALSWVVVAMVTGEPPPEAFAGVRKGEYVDIAVPVADAMIAGWRIAQCSDAVLAPVASEVVRRRRKKPHPEAMALGKVQTTGGPWKALDIPVAAWASPVLAWYALGDRERIEALLRETHALGRGRSGGLGNVDAWSVERDESAVTRWRERPLPVADGAVVEAGRVVRTVGVRHPFWHPRVRTLAECPVIA